MSLIRFWHDFCTTFTILTLVQALRDWLRYRKEIVTENK
jgi:hypothetical protein